MASLSKLIAIAAAALVVFASYEFYVTQAQPGDFTGSVPSAFTVNGKTYTFTYSATTPAERQTGLMNKMITDATTMLFAFPSFGRWSFWMYDTNTSLDMLWLNATGNSARVVFMVTSAPPCYDSAACAVYTPSSPANFVIEAKAGFAAANGVAVGTAVTLG
ncbi:MAG: DUF192 domain-containing protein [Nitrososphaerota archaeon]|nr:DUF192 domain-containing protein [Nitrososphaerota archaeon]MDG6983158.1 DUF192 domain-containing protein [Nitrososphaerota archaeon]